MSGGETVLTFDVKGGKEAAFAFLNLIYIGLFSNNLGDSKFILTHPETTTHQRLSDQRKSKLGTPRALILVSVGL